MLKRGDFRLAEEIFAGLSAASPYDSVFRTNWAASLANLDRCDDALEQYEAAIRFNLANLDALAGAGELLVKAGRIDDALVRFDQALTLDPDRKRIATQRVHQLAGKLRERSAA